MNKMFLFFNFIYACQIVLASRFNNKEKLKSRPIPSRKNEEQEIFSSVMIPNFFLNGRDNYILLLYGFAELMINPLFTKFRFQNKKRSWKKCLMNTTTMSR